MEFRSYNVRDFFFFILHSIIIVNYYSIKCIWYYNSKIKHKLTTFNVIICFLSKNFGNKGH